MILGKIIGKTSTQGFRFLVSGNAKKYQYIQVMHAEGYVLCQIVELEKSVNEEIGICEVIGVLRDDKMFPLRTPLEPNTEVLEAEDDFVTKSLGLVKEKNSAYVGKLYGKDLEVYLDLNKILTKHMAILAKSGYGKSYACSVVVEELLDRQIPVVIIDPHGEYGSLKYPSEDKEKALYYGIEAKGYTKEIQEYCIDESVGGKLLKLDSRNLSSYEIIKLLPAKLSNAQIGVLYSALKNVSGNVNFDELLYSLGSEESSIKWTLINIIEYIKNLGIFSENPSLMNELVTYGKCSIINLKGVSPEIQEVVVYKLLSDLFNTRKKGKIPPFFLVLEEAQNYIPERSFGETKSSSVIRQVLSEGRKFGLGVCLITQRPARIDKTALSQVTTQIILKITNPNDLRAVVNSLEGVTTQTEKEIQNLPIGIAVLVGVVEHPIFVNIRTRKSKHGGEAVSVFDEVEKIDRFGKMVGKIRNEAWIVNEEVVSNEGGIRENSDVAIIRDDADAIGDEISNEIGINIRNKTDNHREDKINESEEYKEILPLIKPKISLEDYKIMKEGNDKTNIVLVPCVIFECSDEEGTFKILVNLNKGEIVRDIERFEGVEIGINKINLSPSQKKIFDLGIKLKEFKPAEIFSKSGMQFSDVYDIIKILTEKGYFVNEDNKYYINKRLLGFLNLRDYETYEQIDFLRVVYDNKLEKVKEASEIREYLNKFVNIKDEQECYLVRYI